MVTQNQRGNEQDVVVTSESKILSSATLADEFDSNHIIVILSNTASLSNFQYDSASFSEIGCKSVENLVQLTTDRVKAKLSGESATERTNTSSEFVIPNNKNEIDTENFNQILLLEITEPGKDNILAAIKKLEQRADVLYAGPNFYCELANEIMPASSNVIGPWDELYDEQWAIEMINLSDAWNISTGEDNLITIGIVDQGVQSQHPDLVGRVNSSKSREIDAAANVNTVSTVTDVSGHGTMIAGIIGARTSNQVGISGVNWDAEIVSLRLELNDQGNTTVATMIKMFQIAEQLEIDILNISIYIILSDSNVPGIEEAAEEFSGLIVCAAGNYSMELTEDSMLYPTCLDIDNMIVVGASNTYDNRWYGSNYGVEIVDLFAPGAAILSCYPTTLCDPDGHITEIPDYHHSYGYHYATGTSFAAPYVAGVASLIWAKYPPLTAEEVKARILNGVDVVSGLMGKCATNGRLNAYKALCNHTYSRSYEYSDSSYHISYCACGMFRYDTHTWLEGDGYLYCEDCGGREYI